MHKWKCSICGWIYDPAFGVPEKDIEPGIEFDDLPEDFRCPPCGAMKKWFNKVE